MQFFVVEPEGLDLTGFQILEISSRWTRTPPVLPGAVRIDPCFVEAGLDTSRYFPRYRQRGDALLSPDLAEWLIALGLNRNVPLLLSTTGPWGPVNGGRVAWALCAASFCDIYWLNGGSEAWTPGEGRPADVGFPIPRHCLATSELDGAVLVDVRSRAEWSGQRQDRYTFFRSCGHIPGAVWLGDWTELVTPQRRLRNRQELRRAWQKRGLTPDRDLVFYCGTGWRSSLACCLALWLGYPRVRNYDGGLYDWVSRGLPLSGGPPDLKRQVLKGRIR